MRTVNSPRRLAGWALVAGLCLAALVAVFALLSGFDDTDWRIIGSSLGFSLFSAIGAAGESLRRAGAGVWVTVGSATAVLAAAAFLFLLGAIWIDDNADWLWQAWGCCGLASLAGSHASIVMRGARPDDGRLIRTLIWISIVTAAIDTTAGLLAITAVFDDIDEGVVEGLAVIGVAMLLSTVLPPILRRLRAEPGSQAHPAFGAVARPALHEKQRLTAELEAIAQRLEELDSSPEVLTEAANLRRLARERQA